MLSVMMFVRVTAMAGPQQPLVKFQLTSLLLDILETPVLVETHEFFILYTTFNTDHSHNTLTYEFSISNLQIAVR